MLISDADKTIGSNVKKHAFMFLKGVFPLVLSLQVYPAIGKLDFIFRHSRPQKNESHHPIPNCPSTQIIRSMD